MYIFSLAYTSGKTVVVISYKLNELILQLCSFNENVFEESGKIDVLLKKILSCLCWCEQHFDLPNSFFVYWILKGVSY